MVTQTRAIKTDILIIRLYLPPSPTQTKRTGLKGLLRSKDGWFTEREEVVMVTRILRDDPGKATMHNVRIFNSKDRRHMYLLTRIYHSDKPSTQNYYGRVSPIMTCENQKSPKDQTRTNDA